jgi:hypothetical protein
VDEKIRNMLLSACVDNRISCAAARRIAEEAGVPYKAVGDAANELGIRITACQLGCF